MFLEACQNLGFWGEAALRVRKRWLVQGLSDVTTGVGGGASALALAWGLAGGGVRAGGGAGKWLGLDPVVPVTSTDLMHSISTFYGCAPWLCPVFKHHKKRIMVCICARQPFG